MPPQVLFLVSKKGPKRVYPPLVLGDSDELEHARCTHIHEGSRYQATRKKVAKLSGVSLSFVRRVMRHPMCIHARRNGLGSDVHVLKVVDDFGDNLSRDMHTSSTSGHW